MDAGRIRGLRSPWPLGPVDLTRVFSDCAANDPDTVWCGADLGWGRHGLSLIPLSLTRAAGDGGGLCFRDLASRVIHGDPSSIPSLVFSLLRPVTLVTSPEYSGLLDIAATRCYLDAPARYAALYPCRQQLKALFEGAKLGLMNAKVAALSTRRGLLQSLLAKACVLDRLHYSGIMPRADEWTALLTGVPLSRHISMGSPAYGVLSRGRHEQRRWDDALEWLTQCPARWATQQPSSLDDVRVHYQASSRVRRLHTEWLDQAVRGGLSPNHNVDLIGA